MILHLRNCKFRFSLSAKCHHSLHTRPVSKSDVISVFRSMPEEDEEYQENNPDSQTSGGGVKPQWTPVPVNSHLHASRMTPTGPMADLRLSEAEMKSR
ncbi:hypothetical protein BaRGS_00004212, partial [Batillaria attramentaria]